MAAPSPKDPSLYTTTGGKRKRTTQPTIADVHMQILSVLSWVQHIDRKINDLSADVPKKKVQRKKTKSDSPITPNPTTPASDQAVFEQPTFSAAEQLVSLSDTFEQCFDMPTLDFSMNTVKAAPLQCSNCSLFKMMPHVINCANGAQIKTNRCAVCGNIDST